MSTSNAVDTIPQHDFSGSATELMSLAITQARTAFGRVAPNPAVGAVIARDGVVIATGATRPPPGPHAEIVALTVAGEAARGADLFVTLEPCAHFGRTPPCVNAIIDAGIRRVVVAMLDPNPVVDGRGVEQLRAAGIAVEIGLLTDEAQEAIAGFTKRIRTGRPLVTAKYAMTLDGRIATRIGHSRWISGPESREHVHLLRDRVDAILVGSGTVLADDPLLTTRIPDQLAGYGGAHHPLRVVLDRNAHMSPNSRMLEADTPGQTLIATGREAPESSIRALEATGAEIVRLNGDLGSVLDFLGTRGVNDLLVEGGAGIHGAFFDSRLVDRVRVYLTPSIVGGGCAPSPVGGRGVATMPEAVRIVDQRVTQFGNDLCIEGRVVYPEEVADVQRDR